MSLGLAELKITSETFLTYVNSFCDFNFNYETGEFITWQQSTCTFYKIIDLSGVELKAFADELLENKVFRGLKNGHN